MPGGAAEVSGVRLSGGPRRQAAWLRVTSGAMNGGHIEGQWTGQYDSTPICCLKSSTSREKNRRGNEMLLLWYPQNKSPLLLACGRLHPASQNCTLASGSAGIHTSVLSPMPLSSPRRAPHPGEGPMGKIINTSHHAMSLNQQNVRKWQRKIEKLTLEESSFRNEKGNIKPSNALRYC